MQGAVSLSLTNPFRPASEGGPTPTRQFFELFAQEHPMVEVYLTFKFLELPGSGFEQYLIQQLKSVPLWMSESFLKASAGKFEKMQGSSSIALFLVNDPLYDRIWISIPIHTPDKFMPSFRNSEFPKKLFVNLRDCLEVRRTS